MLSYEVGQQVPVQIAYYKKCVSIRFVLGTDASHVSILPNQNEAGKYIGGKTVLRTKFRGGVRVQACHVGM